jgi:hypothetical protein
MVARRACQLCGSSELRNVAERREAPVHFNDVWRRSLTCYWCMKPLHYSRPTVLTRLPEANHPQQSLHRQALNEDRQDDHAKGQGDEQVAVGKPVGQGKR